MFSKEVLLLNCGAQSHGRALNGGEKGKENTPLLPVFELGSLSIQNQNPGM